MPRRDVLRMGAAAAWAATRAKLGFAAATVPIGVQLHSVRKCAGINRRNAAKEGNRTLKG